MPTVEPCECGYQPEPNQTPPLCPECYERMLVRLSDTERVEFEMIDRQMPKFITHICADLRSTAYSDVREFEVLREGQKPLSPFRLTYLDTDYDGLAGMLKFLVEASYLMPLGTPETPIYRMSEKFVACILVFG